MRNGGVVRGVAAIVALASIGCANIPEDNEGAERSLVPVGSIEQTTALADGLAFPHLGQADLPPYEDFHLPGVTSFSPPVIGDCEPPPSGDFLPPSPNEPPGDPRDPSEPGPSMGGDPPTPWLGDPPPHSGECPSSPEGKGCDGDDGEDDCDLYVDEDDDDDDDCDLYVDEDDDDEDEDCDVDEDDDDEDEDCDVDEDDDDDDEDEDCDVDEDDDDDDCDADDDDDDDDDDDCEDEHHAASCRVTGGGQSVDGEDVESFGGDARPFGLGVGGEWDHVTPEGDLFHGEADDIDCVGVSDDLTTRPDAIYVEGTGTWNGTPGCRFSLYVEDHGESGRDLYNIDIDCPDRPHYAAGGTLYKGNLQIRAVSPRLLP